MTHLRRPQLHQHGLCLSLLIGALLLEDLPVGAEPEAGAGVLGQTRWLQKLPQSLLSAQRRPLLLWKETERERETVLGSKEQKTNGNQPQLNLEANQFDLKTRRQDWLHQEEHQKRLYFSTSVIILMMDWIYIVLFCTQRALH